MKVQGVPVMGVLGPVPVDHLVAAVVPLQGEVDLQDVGAGLDDLQDAVGLNFLLLAARAHVLHVDVDELVLGQHAGLVEKVLDHLEKSRILCCEVNEIIISNILQ